MKSDEEKDRAPETDRAPDDEVTEAGIESFPASDPPAFAQGDRREHEHERQPAGAAEPEQSAAAEAPADAGGAAGNTDRMRGEMPSGQTIGKQAAEDPAAAPLGTDEEAAGTSPRPAAVESARSEEREPAAPASEVMETRDALEKSEQGASRRDEERVARSSGTRTGWIVGGLVLLLILIWLVF